MRPLAAFWSGVAAASLVASATVYAGRVAADVRPVASCETGDAPLVRDVVYFGRNRPDGGIVTDVEWQRFLDEVVTPRFPAGLTVLSASGQWRGEKGAVEREQAQVLTVLHSGDEAARRAVAEVAGEYKRRFAQEAVLRERMTACTRF
jgi:Protein of unknown function (DUF3574)